MKNVESSTPNHSLVVAIKEQIAASLSREPNLSGTHDFVHESVRGTLNQIWALIQKPTPLDDICNALLQAPREHATAPVTSEQDILLLIKNLAASGLIDVRIDIR